MKKSTIRRALFSSYSIIILISFLSIAAIFCFLEMPKQKERTMSVLEQNCSSMAQSMDKEMEQIRAVAMNIAHSSLIQDKLLHESSSRWDPLTTERSTALQFLLSAMIVPNDHVEQVRLHLPSGEIVCTGRINSVTVGNAEDQAWYPAVMNSPFHNTFVYTGEDDAL